MSVFVETWPAEAGPPPETFDGPAAFSAELAPNRSLPNPAFIALMIAIGAISFTAGVIFITMGAWPVTGFFGLDLVLVWLAFKISYRDGRLREWIRIDARDIELVRRLPAGHVRRYRMPTGWTRLHHAAPGKHDSQIALVSSGKALVVGAFLSPHERDELAAAIKAGLEKAVAPQEAGGSPA